MFRLAALGIAYIATLFASFPGASPQDVVVGDRDTDLVPQHRVTDHVPVDYNTWSELGDLNVLWSALVPYWRDLHGVCGEFQPIALQVGWQPDEWRKLGRIVYRESRCDPTVLNNNAETGDLSYGLTQINMRGSLGPDRLLRCSLSKFEDLWDPATNLRCARILYLGSGWEPWRMPGT